MILIAIPFCQDLKAQLAQQLLTIFPRQAKRTHIRDAKAGRCITHGRRFEVSVQNLHLGPIHELLQRELVTQVSADSIRDNMAINPSAFIRVHPWLSAAL